MTPGSDGRRTCPGARGHAHPAWAVGTAVPVRIGQVSRSPVSKENTIQVQINTDHNIDGREAPAAHFRGIVETALHRFSDQVTRVEVHLSDQSGGHGGEPNGQNVKRCLMEARLAGREPVAVTHQAATLHQAVDGAAGKLTHRIEHTLGHGTRSEGPQA